jgi:hypothetical protein
METTPAEACPLPSRGQGPDTAAIARMLAGRRIAVVGCSDNPDRPSHRVAAYLVSSGYAVVPVNPRHAMVLGVRCYPRLEDVPGQIDVVDVFRRPEFCAAVARSAIAVGARGLWLQSGIRSVEARRLAEQAGIDFVEDRCMLVEHANTGR